MLRRLISSIVMVSMVISSVMWQTVAVAAPLSMTQIYSYAKAGNLKALQSLKQTGNSLEMIDKYGNTALCRSIWMKDYASFFVLKKAGASTASMCVSKIPAEQIQSFNTNYMTWAEGVNSGKIAYPVKSVAQFTAIPNGAVAPSQTTAATTGTQASMSVEPIATTTGLSVGAKVAIGVGALAVIGGGVALAAGGGGGGGSSGGSSEPDTPTPPPQDLCANVNCGSHGTCNASTGACDCTDGYTGASCQTPPNLCANVNCGSHGTCNPTDGSCTCTDGYSGASCQTPPNLCANVNCGSHGTCNASTGACDCTDGYSGASCQTPPNLCANVNCGSHGTCNPTDGSCTCTDGYSGASCQTPPNLCANVSCGSHGTCNPTDGSCTCTDGYSGASCQTPPNLCANVNCGSHGTCNASTGACDCTDGYSGASCQTPPDLCANVNCGDHGTCNPTDGSCTCSDDYTGDLCQIAPAVDPWASRDPQTYKTPEFNKGNFLSQIKAEQAYARGFSGYVTEEKTDAETGTITYVNTPEKVRVGVLDNGTDINHPDLIANIAKDENGNPYGYNFDYGPCRGDDKTNCYGYKAVTSSYGQFVFYDADGETTPVIDGDVTQAAVNSLFTEYADDYDWDKEQNNPNHPLEEMGDADEYTNTMTGDHGTHVAGIIGATKNGNGMHGVAPNVEMVVGVFDPLDHGFEKAMETYAKEKVRVINMSFGATTTHDKKTWVFYAAGKDASEVFNESEINGYKIAAKNDIVIVRAAGNAGADKQASISTGIPLTTTFGAGSEFDMTNLFISVVAASPANTQASYSQFCGAGQAYCLTAPGGDSEYYFDEASEEMLKKIENKELTEDEAVDWALGYMYEKGGIYSTVRSDEKHVMDETGSAYGYMEGTSMATPVVTGSVALLMGAYPHLTSQEVVEILFRSANKDSLVGWRNDGTWTDSFGNTYATSSIFGHGMIDLDAATQPLGELMLATQNTTNGAKISLKDTKLALPRGFNASLSSSLPQAFIGLDDYNRAFPVATQTLVSRAHRSDEVFKRSFRSFMNRHKVKTAGVQDKMSFSFSESITDDDLMGLGALDVRYRFSDKQALHFAYRSDVRSGNGYFNEALSNPFVDMTDAYALTNRFDLNKKTSLSFGAVLGKNGFYEGDEDLNEEFNRSVTAFTTELTWKPAEKITLKAIGGLISEKDAVLGLNGSGAFNTDTTRTYFAGGVVEVRPISSLTLSASYYYGRSQESQTSSLMTLSDLTSDSFALDARYHMDKETFAGVQLSSPLGIRSGRASFNLPLARNSYDDTVYRDQFDISLKSQAREYNFGAYYAHETDDFEWRYELGARIHPDHMEKAKPDYRALFGLRWQY